MAGALFAGVVTKRADDLYGFDADGNPLTTDVPPETKREIETNLYGWTILKPTIAIDSNGKKIKRNVSSKSQQLSSMSENDTCNVFSNFGRWISDQWRRVTISKCDPYIVIQMRPDGDSHMTDAILGGGENVEWTILDNNTKKFNDLSFDTLTKKYLNFRVFDSEIGINDRLLGEAGILLNGISQINQQYYATINLFESKKWVGLLTIGAILIPKKNDLYDLKVSVLYADNLLLADENRSDINGKNKQKEVTLSNLLFELSLIALYILFIGYIFTIIEGWDLGDSVWFMIVTMCCVGYGDFSPSTKSGQYFNSFIIIINLFFFGWAMTIIFSYMASQQAISMRRGNHVYSKQKYKNDYFILKCSKYLDRRVRRAMHIRRKDLNSDHLEEELEIIERNAMLQSHHISSHEHETRLTREQSPSLSPTPGAPGAPGAAIAATRGLSVDSIGGASASGSAIAGDSAHSEYDEAIASLRKQLSTRGNIASLAEEEEEDNNVNEKDNVIEKDSLTKFEKEKRKFLKQALLMSWLLLMGVIALTTIYYDALNYVEAQAQESYFSEQGWPSYYFFDGFRFCIVSISTVGYGDMYPQTTDGRLFCGLFLLFGVSLLTSLVGTSFEMISEWEKEKTKKRKMVRALLSLNAMQEFDEDGSGDIDKYEFLKTMLILRGDVGKRTIDVIMKKFNQIDKDGSGEIDFEDFRQSTQRDIDSAQNNITLRKRTIRVANIDDTNNGYNNNNNDNTSSDADTTNDNAMFGTNETTALLS